MYSVLGETDGGKTLKGAKLTHGPTADTPKTITMIKVQKNQYKKDFYVPFGACMHE